MAKDVAGRRVLVARFNRHRTIGWRHVALRTLGSTFAGDVSSLVVLLLVAERFVKKVECIMQKLQHRF